MPRRLAFHSLSPFNARPISYADKRLVVLFSRAACQFIAPSLLAMLRACARPLAASPFACAPLGQAATQKAIEFSSFRSALPAASFRSATPACFRGSAVAQRNLAPPEQASARIFGTRIGNGLPSGIRYLRALLKGPALNFWYDFPANLEPKPLPGIPVDAAVVKQERRIRRMRRGLMPVKKHQGKRAQAKKGTSKAVATPKVGFSL